MILVILKTPFGLEKTIGIKKPLKNWIKKKLLLHTAVLVPEAKS